MIQVHGAKERALSYLNNEVLGTVLASELQEIWVLINPWVIDGQDSPGCLFVYGTTYEDVLKSRAIFCPNTYCLLAHIGDSGNLEEVVHSDET